MNIQDEIGFEQLVLMCDCSEIMTQVDWKIGNVNGIYLTGFPTQIEIGLGNLSCRYLASFPQAHIKDGNGELD